MTVSTTASRNDYTANGASCEFAYTFRILASTSLDVYQCGTLKTSGYTVSGVDSASGGTVTFTTVPPSGDTIALVRDEPFTQGTDLVENSITPAATIETAFDKVTFLAQQLLEYFNRTFHFTAGSQNAACGAVVRNLQGGKLLRVGNDCNSVEMVDVATISPTSVTVPISIANGGTNSANKTDARTTMDLAINTAPYILLGINTELTCERNLTAGLGVKFTDNGCGGTLVIDSCTKGWSTVVRNASFSCTTSANSVCTQMTLSAQKLALESSCADLVFVRSPNNVTNDISVDSTNKNNSRDQAGAFSAGDVHFYWVYDNGATRSRSSATAPPTGPTLPACETHWAYSHSMYWDANCMRRVTVRGASVFYDCAITVLTAGAATCETRVSLVTSVPAVATSVRLHVDVVTTSTVSPQDLLVGYRLNCTAYLLTPMLPTGNVALGGDLEITIPNVNQELYYRWTQANGSVTLAVTGYEVDNGA